MQEHIIAWHLELWSHIGQAFIVSIIIAKYFDHAGYLFGTMMIGFLAAFFLEPTAMDLFHTLTAPEEIERLSKLDEPIVKSPILAFIVSMLMRGFLASLAIIFYLFVRPAFDGLFIRFFEDKVEEENTTSEPGKNMGSRIDRFVN